MAEYIKKLVDLGLLVDTTVSLNGDNILEAPARIMGGARLYDSEIAALSFIGANSIVHGATIGRYCSVARLVDINQADHPKDWLTSSPFPYSDMFGLRAPLTEQFPQMARVSIGNDVWIGARVCIMPGITVGDGAIIGYGSVVTKDVPPYAIVAGTPAKILRYRFDDTLIERLLAFKWWRFDLATRPSGDIPFSDPNTALDILAEKESAGLLLEIRSNRRVKLAGGDAPVVVQAT